MILIKSQKFLASAMALSLLLLVSDNCAAQAPDFSSEKAERFTLTASEFQRLSPEKQKVWVDALRQFVVSVEKIQSRGSLIYSLQETTPIRAFAWLKVQSLMPKICSMAELVFRGETSHAQSAPAVTELDRLRAQKEQAAKEVEELEKQHTPMGPPSEQAQRDAIFARLTVAQRQLKDAETSLAAAEKFYGTSTSGNSSSGAKVSTPPVLDKSSVIVENRRQLENEQIRYQDTANRARAAYERILSRGQGPNPNEKYVNFLRQKAEDAQGAADLRASVLQKFDKQYPQYAKQMAAEKPTDFRGQKDRLENEKIKADNALAKANSSGTAAEKLAAQERVSLAKSNIEKLNKEEIAKRKLAEATEVEKANAHMKAPVDLKGVSCIYAGWIQRTESLARSRSERCPQPSEKSLERDDGKKMVFSCKTKPVTPPAKKDPTVLNTLYGDNDHGKNTILCNPLIFGFHNNLQNAPLCVPASSDATAQCLAKMESEKGSLVSHKAVIENYTKTFNEMSDRVRTLCSAKTDRLRHLGTLGVHGSELKTSVKDLDETCKVLQYQLSKVESAVNDGSVKPSGAAQ